MTRAPLSGRPAGLDRETALFDRLERIFADLLSRWVAIVERYAWLVVVLCVLSMIGCALYTVRNIGINTDATDMISEELEFRKQHKAYKEAFNRLRNPIVIVIDGATPDLADQAVQAMVARISADKEHFNRVERPGGGPFFERNGLLYLDTDELYDLGDRLAAAQPLLAELTVDESLRGLFDIMAQAADQIADGDVEAPDDLGPVMNELTRAITNELDGRPVYFSWQEIMSGDTGGTGSRRRFIFAAPVEDFGVLRPAKRAIEETRRLAKELNLTPDNGVTIRLTGNAALSDEELNGISKDASRAGLISFVLVGIILFGGLRSPKIAVASLVTIFVGLIWTAAFAVAFVGDFNMISVAFAILFIGLSVDFNIHYGLRFHEALGEGKTPIEALTQTAGDVGWALTVCVAATVIAFYSFTPTAYTGVSDLGLIAGTGMIIALFATMTLLPALLAVLRVAAPRRGSAAASLALTFDRVIARSARPITIIAVVVGVAAAIESSAIRFDFDPINLRDPNTESVQTYRDLQQDPKNTTESIKVIEPDLSQAEAVAKRLDALTPVKNAITLASFVPKDQDEKLAIIDGLHLTLLPILQPMGTSKPAPDRAQQITAADVLRVQLDRLAAAPDAGNLAEPARSLSAALDRLTVDAKSDPGIVDRLDSAVFATFPEQMDRLRTAMEAQPVTLKGLPADLREDYVAADGRARIVVTPAIDTRVPANLDTFVNEVRDVAPNATGGPVLIAETGRAIIDAFILASFIAAILITGLLLLVLRTVSDTILVLMPLVLAAVLTMATAALLDIPFNFANVIVLPLLLGLAVDGGIHMVMRDKALSMGQALMQTSTPRAIILSALTTVCSFGSLAISSHQGTASMGKLLAISLAYTLVATLIVLPATLALKEQLARRSYA